MFISRNSLEELSSAALHLKFLYKNIYYKRVRVRVYILHIHTQIKKYRFSTTLLETVGNYMQENFYFFFIVVGF